MYALALTRSASQVSARVLHSIRLDSSFLSKPTFGTSTFSRRLSTIRLRFRPSYPVVGGEDQPLREGRYRHGLDVVGQHVATAVEPGVRLRELEDGEGAPGQLATSTALCPRVLLTISTMYLSISGSMWTPSTSLLISRSSPLDTTSSRLVSSLCLLVRLSRISTSSDWDGYPMARSLHDEPVQLRLGEGVGPLVLDGVLSGEDDEGCIEPEGRVLDGDLALLHRLEEGRLRPGRGPVYLIGEEDVAEDRALPDLELYDVPWFPGRSSQ